VVFLLGQLREFGLGRIGVTSAGRFAMFMWRNGKEGIIEILLEQRKGVA
jgi:hypothetical protein